MTILQFFENGTNCIFNALAIIIARINDFVGMFTCGILHDVDETMINAFV